MTKRRSIITTNEEAEYIRQNHLSEYLNVDINSEGEYINIMTGPSVTLEKINWILNTSGPNNIVC